MDRSATTPDGLPLLAAGRHRRPRDGACLMELVSVLAGERWTDAPRCTHPLLARLARLVNDATSDDARPRLARLAPSLVGLRPADDARPSWRTRSTPTGDRWDLELASLAAATALHVGSPWYQRPLAAAVLSCEQLAGDPPDAGRRARSEAALAAAPEAARWAAEFVAGLAPRRRVDAHAVVELAVRAIARSDALDVDARLAALLADAVALAERLTAPTPAAPTSTARSTTARREAFVARDATDPSRPAQG